MENINCEFSNPWYFDPDTKELKPFNGGDSGTSWHWKNLNCTSTDNAFSEQFALIENPETGANFYLDKTLNYGEAILIWFFVIFGFFMIAKTVWNFFWKK